MYRSWFSYQLTKPYPFPWFTPVVIVGGLALTAVFSIINFATGGFDLQTTYTTDPNATLANRQWYQRAPWSWAGALESSCSATNMAVGSQFFTANLGLSYILTGVTKVDPITNRTLNLPTLPYSNQNLENCTVNYVSITLLKTDQSDGGSARWWSWDVSSSAFAEATCIVATDEGPLHATFKTVNWDAEPTLYNYVVQLNYTASSSLWWGTRLLNLYWSSTLMSMSMSLYPKSSNGNDWVKQPAWVKGAMVFTPNNTVADITSDYAMNLTSYFFLGGDGDIYNTNIGTLAFNNPDDVPYSGPLTEGSMWAKLMYSMVLVDLGQSTTAPGQPKNILLDPNLIQWALHHPNDAFRNDPTSWLNATNQSASYDWANYGALAPPDGNPQILSEKNSTLMAKAYDAFKSKLGPLQTNITTIYNQYSCNVLARKGNGTLFWSILVADLVFLSTSWAVLVFVADQLVERRYADAMFCPGCAVGAVNGHDGEAFNLTTLQSTRASIADDQVPLTSPKPESPEYLKMDPAYQGNPVAEEDAVPDDVPDDAQSTRSTSGLVSPDLRGLGGRTSGGPARAIGAVFRPSYTRLESNAAT